MKEAHEITCPRCHRGPGKPCMGYEGRDRPRGEFCDARYREVEARARRAERKAIGDRPDR